MVFLFFFFFFFFKQKTAYEIVPCDWSSDVCSSDLGQPLWWRDRNHRARRRESSSIRQARPSDAVYRQRRRAFWAVCSRRSSRFRIAQYAYGSAGRQHRKNDGHDEIAGAASLVLP